MTAPHTPEHIQVYVSAEEIADPQAFEELRRAAYGETTKDSAGRLQAMDDLIRMTDTAAGEPLIDAVLARTTADSNLAEADKGLNEAAARMAKVSQGAAKAALGSAVYRFEFNAATGAVEGIQRHTELPEDKDATRQNAASAKRIPWGRAVNTVNIGGRSGDGMRSRKR